MARNVLLTYILCGHMPFQTCMMAYKDVIWFSKPNSMWVRPSNRLAFQRLHLSCRKTCCSYCRASAIWRHDRFLEFRVLGFRVLGFRVWGMGRCPRPWGCCTRVCVFFITSPRSDDDDDESKRVVMAVVEFRAKPGNLLHATSVIIWSKVIKLISLRVGWWWFWVNCYRNCKRVPCSLPNTFSYWIWSWNCM